VETEVGRSVRRRQGVTTLVEVFSGTLVGVTCTLVKVEVSVATGLPSISVVGLPQSAVREGKDRVRAALQAAGYAIPPRRITVNLSPADLKKEGSGFDLPLALGLLAGSGHIPPASLDGCVFIGELGLNGELRPVRGILAAAAMCRDASIASLTVPSGNAQEAAAGAGAVTVCGPATLHELVCHLRGTSRLAPISVAVKELLSTPPGEGEDLLEVRGQAGAKRAMEVAAAGGHNLLLTGCPGSGKTMLARRMVGILPPLSPAEAIEVTTVHSVAGLLPPGEALIRRRPFRSPHHTASAAGLVGGGVPSRPGEISLAHCGVLFLDELPEFPRQVLETLRQPLEDGNVSLVRARDRTRYPARFTLVAAMNPCPCGHLGDPRNDCTCDPSQVVRYRSRISGPLLDRIDLRVDVPVVPYRELADRPTGESSSVVRTRVARARRVQCERWRKVGCLGVSQDSSGKASASEGTGRDPGSWDPVLPAPEWNSALGPAGIRRWCRLGGDGERILEDASERMGLSSRGVHRILRVARTVADLDGMADIGADHLAEALYYRG
jgi:magnesium chelatase family protein